MWKKPERDNCPQAHWTTHMWVYIRASGLQILCQHHYHYQINNFIISHFNIGISSRMPFLLNYWLLVTLNNRIHQFWHINLLITYKDVTHLCQSHSFLHHFWMSYFENFISKTRQSILPSAKRVKRKKGPVFCFITCYWKNESQKINKFWKYTQRFWSQSIFENSPAFNIN